ncbi:hypothetical protein CYFUS_008956 [Cystobacter fuscus]|uniref:Uncharacterized protein n=1 Tax=Cystobacter fuscus TaxID=43 RepID=A0A250JK23_9BACT|nr:hypothetical protein CYFUS_008956 [Cystobacter fuscus]
MKESYIEGLATHDGPESCVDIREGAALTGGQLMRQRQGQGANPTGPCSSRYSVGSQNDTADTAWGDH